MKPLVIFIVGPTATGKSEVAIELAQRIQGEIISADSMQVYKGMDIGTAKPSLLEQKKVSHHLIDILSCNQEYNAFDFTKRARELIRQICIRGNIPLIVGGSGLYVNTLLEGIFEGPSTDWNVRMRLFQEAEQYGVVHLHERLRRVDPQSAALIMTNDLRRIIRALEVFEKARIPISSLKDKRIPLHESYTIQLFGLAMERTLLYTRIEQRVDGMVKAGLVEEVRRISQNTVGVSASQALGYKEFFQYFQGQCTLDEAIEEIKKRTRHFAKRQITWFKKNKDIVWIVREKNMHSDAIVDRIMYFLRCRDI